jgi:serine/threonine-protein kinase
VPPELDKLCALATGQDPEQRPAARKLAEDLQAYLDGDRDVVRRKQLAIEHAEHARVALTAGDDDEARARAMREVGRALVFDPANRAAQELLAKLLIAPDRIPAAALAAADAERAAARTKVVSDSAKTYAAYGVLACLLFVFPIHAAWPVILAIVLSVITAVILGVMSRRDLPLRTPWEPVVVCANGLLLSVSGLLFGSLFLTPIFTVGTLTVYLSQPTGYSRWWIVTSHVLAFGVPVALELVGVLPSTFATVNGNFVLSPWAFDLTPFTTGLFTAMAMIAQGAIGWRLLTTTLNVQLAAQNRVHSQQWHLAQLLPKV